MDAEMGGGLVPVLVGERYVCSTKPWTNREATRTGTRPPVPTDGERVGANISYLKFLQPLHAVSHLLKTIQITPVEACHSLRSPRPAPVAPPAARSSGRSSR